MVVCSGFKKRVTMNDFCAAHAGSGLRMAVSYAFTSLRIAFGAHNVSLQKTDQFLTLKRASRDRTNFDVGT